MKHDPNREAAIALAVRAAHEDMIIDGDASPGRIIACQGQPFCDRADAVARGEPRCAWCSVIMVERDGTVRRDDPVFA